MPNIIYKQNTFIPPPPSLNLSGDGGSYRPLYSNFPNTLGTYANVQRFPNLVESGSNFWIIDRFGDLWFRGTDGYNSSGGVGTTTSVFKRIMQGCYQIKAIGGALIVLKNNGELWGFGYDDYAVMGLGAPETTVGRLPTLLATNVVSFDGSTAAARCHYIDTEGNLFASGINTWYTLPGIANGAYYSTFTQVASNAKSVFATAKQVFYVENGTNIVRTMGYPAYGTASYGSYTTDWVPVVGLTGMVEIWDYEKIYCRQTDSEEIFTAKNTTFASVGYARQVLHLGTYPATLGFGLFLGQGTNGSLMKHTWSGTETGNLTFIINGLGRCGEFNKGGVFAVPNSVNNKLKKLALTGSTYYLIDDPYLIHGAEHVISRELQLTAYSGGELRVGAAMSVKEGGGKILMHF